MADDWWEGKRGSNASGRALGKDNQTSTDAGRAGGQPYSDQVGLGPAYKGGWKENEIITLGKLVGRGAMSAAEKLSLTNLIPQLLRSVFEGLQEMRAGVQAGRDKRTLERMLTAAYRGSADRVARGQPALAPGRAPGSFEASQKAAQADLLKSLIARSGGSR